MAAAIAEGHGMGVFLDDAAASYAGSDNDAPEEYTMDEIIEKMRSNPALLRKAGLQLTPTPGVSAAEPGWSMLPTRRPRTCRHVAFRSKTATAAKPHLAMAFRPHSESRPSQRDLREWPSCSPIRTTHRTCTRACASRRTLARKQNQPWVHLT